MKIDLAPITVGGQTLAEIDAKLTAAKVEKGFHCPTTYPVLDQAIEVMPRLRSLDEIGLPYGGRLVEILEAGNAGGLGLGSPDFGPALRLAMPEQEIGPDHYVFIAMQPVPVDLSRLQLEPKTPRPVIFWLTGANVLPLKDSPVIKYDDHRWLHGRLATMDFFFPPNSIFAWI